MHPPPMDRVTDTCENITFPHTPYVVGNERNAKQKILGSESFTRWLVMGTSASAPIRGFCVPTAFKGIKVKKVGFECLYYL